MTPETAPAFSQLGLSGPTLEALDGLGLSTASEFQASAIPPLLARRDLLALTGPGDDRDVAFAIPLIERVIEDGPAYNPTALILVPTRDDAIRIHETIFQLSGKGASASVLGVYEGKAVTSQIGPLKHGVDIVVGTPGRTLEHVKRRTLRIEQLKALIIAGADSLFESGLPGEVEAILRETPKSRQTAVLSAEMPERVLAFAGRHLRDPELLGVEPAAIDSAAAATVPASPMTNVYFGAGKAAKISPRDLVGAITNEGGLDGDQVGLITIKENFSLVAIPIDSAEETVRRLQPARIKGRKVKIRLERFRRKG